MAILEISAKKKDSDVVVTASYNMPDTVAELVNQFGEDAVFGATKAQFVIAIQALMRRHLDKSQEEVQQLVNDWRPDTRSAPSRPTTSSKARTRPARSAGRTAFPAPMR